MAAEQEQSQQQTVSAEQAREKIASGEARAFDLRDDEEWQEGRVPGAARLDDENLDQSLEELDEGQQVILVCEDGQRSAELAGKLRERDIEAFSLEGGMKAWGDEKLRMQPSTDPDDDVGL